MASRGGDEDTEALSSIGSAAVASKLLPANTLRLTVLLPYDTPEQMEASIAGSTASSLVNIWRLLYFPNVIFTSPFK